MLWLHCCPNSASDHHDEKTREKTSPRVRLQTLHKTIFIGEYPPKEKSYGRKKKSNQKWDSLIGKNLFDLKFFKKKSKKERKKLTFRSNPDYGNENLNVICSKTEKNEFYFTRTKVSFPRALHNFLLRNIQMILCISIMHFNTLENILIRLSWEFWLLTRCMSTPGEISDLFISTYFM